MTIKNRSPQGWTCSPSVLSTVVAPHTCVALLDLAKTKDDFKGYIVKS